MLAVDSLQLHHALPDSFLIPGSEILFADSARLRITDDYKIDYISGSFSLPEPLVPGTVLTVRYRYFPFSLRRRYSHRRIVRAQSKKENSPGDSGTNSSLPRQPVQVSREILPSNLRKSGSIIRGVSVGSNQGLQVDSGLRLQVSGHLARNVEVVASLTDQNTPIQPEGNTQRLQEIDKVFVQIKGPNLQATLGDYTLDFTGSELTNYHRKLEGVMVQGDFANSAFKISAAVSRGQFITNEFMGQEGNQGPYQLHGENGNINILVLAGTEKVWIDGELMTRGENQDYIIEYGNGQITFTRNRLITGDSRIVVDFQFSDESFQRNYVSAQGQTRLLNDKVKLGMTFIRESDAKDDPLTIPLSADALAALEAAGDGAATVPGDTLVGEGKGSYVKDSTGVFIYVGPNKGNYNVRFSFFGPGRGDYRNIGLQRFEFVGENNGDYRPVILFPKAQQHDLVGLNLEVSPASYFKVNSEFAFSQLDNNLYSSLDDGDNQGAAYTIKFNFKPEQMRFAGLNLGRANFSGRLRRKTATFNDVDRTTVAEFNRRWNIDSSIVTNEEQILELQGQVLPLDGVSLRGAVGRLDKSSQFSANRWEVQAQLQRPTLPRVDYFIEFIDREDRSTNDQSDWLRQRGRAEANLWRLNPSFEYEGEIRKDTQNDSSRTGFRFDSYTARLGFAPWKRLLASARYTIRDDKDRLNGVFSDKSIAKTQSYALALKNWHDVEVAASYTHRSRDFEDQAIRDTRTDLANFRIGYRPRQLGVRSNLYYQISNTQVARQEEVFIEVDEGEGNFRFNEQLNEFEPDPFGNFVRRLFTTNDFIPVVELRMRADVRLTPAKFFAQSKGEKGEKGFVEKALSALSTETFVRIDERSTEKDVRKVYLLQPQALQQDSTTIFGTIEFRQDVHLWQNSRKFSLRYRYRSRNELNNQFIRGGQKRQVLAHRLRLRTQVAPQVSARIEYAVSQENRLFQSPGREDRKVRSNEFELDLVYRPQRKWEVAVKSVLSKNKDIVREPNTRATLVSFAPRATYSLSSRGRARAEVEWTRVTLAPKDRLIPFELTQGNRAGTTFRWNFGLDYRLSQNVQASMSYFGRSEPDRPRTQHIARIEMRAFF